MKHKIAVILMCMVLCLLMLPMSVFAETMESGYCGTCGKTTEWRYVPMNDGTGVPKHDLACCDCNEVISTSNCDYTVAANCLYKESCICGRENPNGTKGGHVWGDWGYFSPDGHKRFCNRDIRHNEYAPHSFTDDSDTTCDDCGYERTTKLPASVTKAPEAITGLKFKEENGIEVQQILVTAGEAAGGTMVYRIDDGEWSTTIPARGQVRDYTVYYKVRGDSDHNDSAEGSVRVSIAKADAPIVNIPTQQHIYTTPTTGNSINIKSLLPELCAIMDEQSKVDGITGDFITNAVLNNGVLTYDTDAVNAPSTGTIKVKIVMRNYEDVTVTVNVELISAPHVHSYGTDWKSDGTNHWHECSCGAKANEAAHDYDNDKDAACNTCGYERAVAVEPSITSPTTAQTVTVCEGEQAVMSIVAENAASYQWYVDYNDGTGWHACGDGKPSYTTSPVRLSNDGYRYYCRVTNADGEADSCVFTLKVNALPSLPQTGDNSTLGLWLAMLSMAGCTLLLLRRRAHN